MPPFITALISPFLDFFSFVGIPVEKIPTNDFYTTERVHYEQEIQAAVRQVNDFEYEFPAKVIEVINPFKESNHKTPFMEDINCNTEEIPIILMNNDEFAYIMTSSSTNQNKGVVDWNRYIKVSETKTVNRYGYNITLEELLNDISKPKRIEAPIRRPPVASIVQGGLSSVEQNPLHNHSIHDKKPDSNQHNCTGCDEKSIKFRPNFPFYAPIIQGF